MVPLCCHTRRWNVFGRKSRGQVIGEELSEGFSHVRTAANEATKAAAEALAPRVEAARDAVSPRVEAAREAIVPRVEATRGAIVKGLDTAREQAEERLALAREQAESKRAEIANASRRSAKKTAKRAKKNAKRAKKTAVGARKDAKSAIAEAKAQAKAAGRSGASGSEKKRRRWPFLLAIVGVVGAVVAKNRAKTDDDLWGAPSDSPVRGYTEDPQPSTASAESAIPATDDPYPGVTAEGDGTAVGDSPVVQDEPWSEPIDATTGNDDGPNPEEAAKHAAKEPTKKPKNS
jgi:hypothetical protein